ncbi:MAG: hypothetical protein L0Y54_19555 [Sporichthyaceae bacterium]|nr:hypothetical protein [Sporichthyaceae bacterium]
MYEIIPISAVRTRVFELFDEVVERPGRKVVIAHRDRAERAVLVSEAYLAELEARVATLETVVARVSERASAEPFSLIGSARLHSSPDAVLDATRADQAGRAARKFSQD